MSLGPAIIWPNPINIGLSDDDVVKITHIGIRWSSNAINWWQSLIKRGLCILQTFASRRKQSYIVLGIAFKKRSLHITNIYKWMGILINTVGNCFQNEVFAYYKHSVNITTEQHVSWELLSKWGLCILQTLPWVPTWWRSALGIAFKMRSLHITNIHSAFHCSVPRVGNCFQNEVFAYYKHLAAGRVMPHRRWELLSKWGLCILQTFVRCDMPACAGLGIAFKMRSLHITNIWRVFMGNYSSVGNCFQNEVFAYYKHYNLCIVQSISLLS